MINQLTFIKVKPKSKPSATPTERHRFGIAGGIALQIKQEANWTCQLCGLGCIPTGKIVSDIGRSERARQRLEVHHINYKPEDNRRENLIALCSACHLRQHRRHGSVHVGQLSLFA